MPMLRRTWEPEQRARWECQHCGILTTGKKLLRSKGFVRFPRKHYLDGDFRNGSIVCPGVKLEARWVVAVGSFLRRVMA
jgi:hypothetical protein